MDEMYGKAGSNDTAKYGLLREAALEHDHLF